MLKKTLALFLSLLLCVSGSVMAFAASDNAQVIMGEVDIVNPTFVVSVPLNLDFKLDPLKIKGQSQIFSGDTSYNIVNKATVPVKVDFALKITATTGVTFVADNSAGTLDKALPGAAPIDKKLYVAIQGAESIDTTKIYDSSKGTIANAPSGGNLAATTVSGNVVPVYATSATTTTNLLDFEETGSQEASGIFSFLVGAGVADAAAPTDASKQKPTAESMTSFRLFGDLNTYAAWDAADFTFEGSYDFIGVAQEDYEAAIDGSGDYTDFMLDTDSAPALVKEVAEYAALATPLTFDQAGFVNADKSDAVASIEVAAKTGVWTQVPFYFDGKTVESFKIGATALVATNARVNGNNLEFNFGSTGDKVIIVKLKDDATVYTVTLKM